MTRINCVPPEELHGKHLLAEYRELPRIFSLVRKRVEKGQSPEDVDQPEQYTLGFGHVTFFYNKLGWLVDRQKSLIREMQRRGYKASQAFQNPNDLLQGIPEEWHGYWVPDQNALTVNRQRIDERVREMRTRTQTS